MREARLAELKRATGGSAASGGNSNGGGSNNGSNEPIGASISRFLEPEAFERLTRVSLVRPDRAQAVEQYLKQIISTGQLQHKVNEKEIVQILNGIAKEQNKKNETKIIFDRRETVVDSSSHLQGEEDDDDDFFD